MALHQGKSLKELSTQSEKEFNTWGRYARHYMLPQRRIEMYLAQISYMIAVTMGGVKDASIQDFLFDPPPEIDPMEQLKAAKEAFGFTPRKKRGR